MNAKVSRQKFKEKDGISIISKYLPQVFTSWKRKSNNLMMKI